MYKFTKLAVNCGHTLPRWSDFLMQYAVWTVSDLHCPRIRILRDDRALTIKYISKPLLVVQTIFITEILSSKFLRKISSENLKSNTKGLVMEGGTMFQEYAVYTLPTHIIWNHNQHELTKQFPKHHFICCNTNEFGLCFLDRENFLTCHQKGG